MTLTKVKMVGAAVLCTAAAGCGASNTPTKDKIPGPPAARPLDLVFGDCSSFRLYTKAFVPDMVTIAENSALAKPRRTLWGACFDGAPLRTLKWNPTIDFGDEPKELKRNHTLGDRVALGRALGTRKKFEAMANTPMKVPGSGQLEALEVAAQTANLGRVYMFTDAALNEIEGINLATATEAEIDALVAHWAPRLNGLKGVQLMFIGVGRGTGNSAAVRNAERLFRGLATAVGASYFAWTLALPSDFPVGIK
jgi:hypothetical protein